MVKLLISKKIEDFEWFNDGFYLRKMEDNFSDAFFISNFSILGLDEYVKKIREFKFLMSDDFLHIYEEIAINGISFPCVKIKLMQENNKEAMRYFSLFEDILIQLVNVAKNIDFVIVFNDNRLNYFLKYGYKEIVKNKEYNEYETNEPTLDLEYDLLYSLN